jgi:alpha-mannosidase
MARIIKGVELLAIVCAVLFLLRGAVIAQTNPATPAPKPKAAQSATAPHVAAPKPDLAKQPTLYVVGYAHLDTQWRWEYPQVISEYILRTMRDNFSLFEKYPHYIFNFSGANRYRMMKEYYPADYEKVKHYIAIGRWFPAGSSMEESDVNTPSAESIFRQVLYGNTFFRREFGKASAEYMLPDCFGFPASLPSILSHAGVRGFSTQKLTWGSSATGGPGTTLENTPVGIPFNVGWWEGPDGKGVIAAFNPGSYGANITDDLSKSWVKRVQLNGAASGLFTDYHYYGTGDIGGSPREPSVALLEAIVTKGMGVFPIPPLPGGRGAPQQQPPPPNPAVKVGDGPLRVISSNAEQMFLDINPAAIARMPRFRGELELTNHSAGSLTSQTVHKRWNRQNELLADAAERASIAAEWLGARRYPLQRLNDAWTLVMGGQFHDNMAGTATPKAYEFSWNDDVIAMNQFASVLTSATEAITSGMDTRGAGSPIVVYNPLNIAREDVVEARVNFPTGAPKAVKVIGPDGKEVPAQVIATSGNVATVLFLARASSVGFAVYDVQASVNPIIDSESALSVTLTSLENARYRLKVDDHGDVSSIFDKKLNRELLSAPARLAFQTERPHDWPAWNMDWADQQRPPRGYVDGPARVRIVENGPVRVALEIERDAERSHFVQTVRLSAGDAGNRVEFSNVIDWMTGEAALKAVFPLTASNPEATYNWDLGTVSRGNNNERMFEMPSHQWFDLTDKGGNFGVTILSDCKYASDKPNDNTLRLTLVYTPGLGDGNGRGYIDQITQDWGRHEFVYGLAGHADDWRQSESDWQGYRLNQPLIAFSTPSHTGALGKTFSVLKVSNSRVRVLALKKAELSNEVILRVVEMSGMPAENVHFHFGGTILAAREVNGQEQPIGPAVVASGDLVTSLNGYQPRTFALKLAPGPSKNIPHKEAAVTLPYDRIVASMDGAKAEGGFDDAGHSLPAEMLPTEITFAGIQFKLAAATPGKPNAVIARGQTISLPAGNYNRIYILAASSEGDQRATFKLGDAPTELNIENWGGFIGQWDNRLWDKHQEAIPLRAGAPPPAPGTPPRMRTVSDYGGLVPGFIKRAPLAWYASHRHTAEGANEPYSYSYLFAYAIDLPAGTKTLTLPNNDKIRVMAVTVVDADPRVRPARPLYDTLQRGGQ